MIPHSESFVNFNDVDISHRQAGLGQEARNCISRPIVNVIHSILNFINFKQTKTLKPKQLLNQNNC